MANIFSLFGTIFINNEEADKSIDQTTKKGESAGSKIGKAFGTIGKAAVAMGTATVSAAGTVGAAAYKMASNTAAQADEIDKVSQKLGLSRETYQEWDYVLSQAGVEITSMSTGLKTLTNKIDDAKNGSKSAEAMFGKLGISLDDLNNMSREDIFEATITAMQGMEDSTERAALANDLFGKSGQELTALFNESAESTENLKNKAHELGMVMSDEAIDAGVQFTDSMDTIKRSMGGVMNSLGSVALPIVQKVLNLIENKMPQVQALFTGFAPILQALFDGVLPPLFDLVETILPILFTLIQTLLPPIQQIVTMVLPIIVQLLQQLLPPLIDLLGNILPPIIDLLVALLPLLQPLLDLLLAILLPLIDLLNIILPPLIEFITLIVSIVEETLTPVIEGLSEIISFFAEAINEHIQNAIEFFTGFIDFIVEDFFGGWSSGWEDIKQVFVDIFKAIHDFIAGIWDGIKTIFSNAFNAVKNTVTTSLDNVKQTFTNIFDAIKNVVTTITDTIKKVIENTLKGIADRFKNAYESIKKIFENIKNVFTGIIDFIKNVFTGNWRGAWDNVIKIFSNIFEGIKEAFKMPINWIIDGMNWFIDGLNEIQIPDWVPVVGGAGLNIPNIPRLRVGLDYVPYDDYPAMLHKGEQVLTASEREEYQAYKWGEADNAGKQQTVNVNVSVNIGSIENKTEKDVDDFIDLIMYKIEEKIKRKGVVFS